ncbi:hypothetical protein DYB32_003410 [Aphanomyces invadans]|uniref:Uncharacterized protein n=1 Tax=Aphanomyces invadans TaxID=157072 RepID=A0A3R6YBD3_9STRA|nr:hypothetical protein DYB32_003410 [Aphanomyces invadans]
MDLTAIPRDAVVLTADNKARILDLLQNISKEYQIQAHKLDWQTQLLEAKQSLIDKYEAKDALSNDMELNIEQSPHLTDGIHRNGSSTLTNTTELSSTNFIGSFDNAPTSSQCRLATSLSLVQQVKLHLDRLPLDDVLRLKTEQLCMLVSTQSADVSVLRRSLKLLQDRAQSNAMIVTELRREHDISAMRLQHRRLFQRVLQEDTVRLRDNYNELLNKYTRERECAEDMQIEYAHLQEDFAALEQENYQQRDVLAQTGQKYSNVMQKLRNLAALNSQSNERLVMLQEDNIVQQSRLQDIIRGLQARVDSMATDPLWLEFVNDRQLHMNEQGDANPHIISLQQELSRVTSEHKRCLGHLAEHQNTINELKRVLIVQEGKWRDQTASLLHLVDSQDQELAQLHENAASIQQDHLKAVGKMQHNLDSMKCHVESLQESNSALVAMVKDYVTELKSAKRELHRRFLECESLKVAGATIQVECNNLR